MSGRTFVAFPPLLALLAALSPSLASARPIDKPFDLVVGKEEFFRAFLKAVAVDEPSVAQVELLPSQEVLLSPTRAGRALLFLVGETRLDVVRLRVRAEQGGKSPAVHATDEQRALVKKACPGFKEEGPDEERAVTVAISSPTCRAALKELLAADEYSTRRVELNFAPEALVDQLMAIRAELKERGLDAAVQVTYSGLTLVLKGKATPAQRLELWKALFLEVVGPVMYEDEIEEIVVKPAPQPEALEPPDAGSSGPDAGAQKPKPSPKGAKVPR